MRAYNFLFYNDDIWYGKLGLIWCWLVGHLTIIETFKEVSHFLPFLFIFSFLARPLKSINLYSSLLLLLFLQQKPMEIYILFHCMHFSSILHVMWCYSCTKLFHRIALLLFQFLFIYPSKIFFHPFLPFTNKCIRQYAS